MTQGHDYRMLEETVWKFLDLLESQGYCEETQQTFGIVKVTSHLMSYQEKADELVARMKRYSRHKSDSKYHTPHIIKDY